MRFIRLFQEGNIFTAQSQIHGTDSGIEMRHLGGADNRGGNPLGQRPGQGAGAPVLRVRLQESLGLTEPPRVDGGKRPVLMELLSPGYKPVQLTSDLRSFWEGTYFEVRKELRRRYSKHSWPEYPLEAELVRGIYMKHLRRKRCR